MIGVIESGLNGIEIRYPMSDSLTDEDKKRLGKLGNILTRWLAADKTAVTTHSDEHPDNFRRVGAGWDEDNVELLGALEPYFSAALNSQPLASAEEYWEELIRKEQPDLAYQPPLFSLS